MTVLRPVLVCWATAWILGACTEHVEVSEVSVSGPVQVMRDELFEGTDYNPDEVIEIYRIAFTTDADIGEVEERLQVSNSYFEFRVCGTERSDEWPDPNLVFLELLRPIDGMGEGSNRYEVWLPVADVGEDPICGQIDNRQGMPPLFAITTGEIPLEFPVEPTE